MKTRFQSLLFSVLICTTHVALGAIQFNSVDDLPKGVAYDFIIAGGGTAGATVASRLGQHNSKWNVLVVEAGPSPSEVFETRVPGLWPTLGKTRVDWNYTSVAQTGLNGRSVEYSRARMLGGCSSHNAMVYTRGSKGDWDRYGDIAGDDAFKWDNVLPLLEKAEHLTKPTPEGHLDASVHGKDGGIGTSAAFNAHPFDDVIMKASEEQDEFPFVLDMNAGRVIGTGWLQTTIENGERSSSAIAYIGKTGDNVHVLLNTHVARVVHASTSPSKRRRAARPEFRAIEVLAGPESRKTKIIAKKEVIVSGGVIGSPHILLHSGIGNKEELAKVGIKALVDNPSVGKNMSDHHSTPVAFLTTTPSNDFDQEAALEQWKESKTGPLSLPVTINQISWVRFPEFSGNALDPTDGGEDTPHIELSWTTISANSPTTPGPVPQFPPDAGNVTIQFAVVNLHPFSRGSISLSSSDPLQHPLIDFGLFTDEGSTDIAISREGIRSARRLFEAPAFKDVVLGSVLPAANVTSDEDLDAYIRAISAPFLHGVGSASMSARDADWGVVDPDFKVKGVDGLRVVDGSVIPLTPSAHTQAPVYGMAERASIVIADAWE